LLEELARLTPELADEGKPVLSEATDRTQTRTAAAYPFVTGALRAGLRVLPPAPTRGRYRLRARVESRAPHAHLYEFGTVRARAHPTFLPIAREEQTTMVKTLAGLVRAYGLRVTGD
jgi:hypothetical protein